MWFPGNQGMDVEQETVSNSDNRVLLLCKTHWSIHGETLPRDHCTFFFQRSLECSTTHAYKHVVGPFFDDAETQWILPGLGVSSEC